MKKTNVKGFTIIEVVLVLAIAGLIFLVVFLALPALQRQQRDTQRRSDASRASSLMSNFKANNNGRLPLGTGTAPTQQTNFQTSYLKSATEFDSPSTNAPYAIVWVGNGGTGTLATQNASTNVDQVTFGVNHSCNGDQLQVAQGKFAVRIPLENGGAYCVGEN